MSASVLSCPEDMASFLSSPMAGSYNPTTSSRGRVGDTDLLVVIPEAQEEGLVIEISYL